MANEKFYTSDPINPQRGLSLLIRRGAKSVQPCGSRDRQRAGASAAGAIYELTFSSPDR